MGLLAIAGILCVTATVAGVLVTEREAHLVQLETTVSQLEGQVRALDTAVSQALSVSSRPMAKSP